MLTKHHHNSFIWVELIYWISIVSLVLVLSTLGKPEDALVFFCKVCGVVLANAWYVFSSVFDDQDCNATWEGRRAWGPTGGEINFQQKVIPAKSTFWRKQLNYVFIENCPRWSRISVSSVWSPSQATTNWSSTSGQFKLCQPSKIGNSPQILILFFIPFCAGFTRGRSRTSAHTASAGSSNCHMSSSTRGFIQVANQIKQLCDPLYLLCPYVPHLRMTSLPKLPFL